MENLYYFYPGILILGIITSYTDIKNRVIKNRHVLFGLIYGLLIYLYMYIFNKKIYLLPIWLFILNIITAVCIAYILYLRHLWSAGDAKLFVTLSFLTPSLKYIDQFKLPTLTLFINISIIGFVSIIVIDSIKIFMNVKYTPISVYKHSLNKFFNSLLIIFSITWIIWLLLSKINFSQPMVKLIIVYSCYFIINKWVEKIKSYNLFFILILSLGLILRLLMQPYIFLSLEKMISYFFTILKYTILFNLLDILLTLHTAKGKDKDAIKRNIAFVPFMFLGAMTIESPLIDFVLKLLSLLRK